MMFFAELKVLTENVGGQGHHERSHNSLRAAAERRRSEQWKGAEASQERGTTAERKEVKQRVGEEGANEDMDEEVSKCT